VGGFVPVAVWAWHSHSNHILWLAVSAFYTIRMAALAVQLLLTLSSDVAGDIEKSIESI
jgi:MATE family multidrug resistance protein